MKQLDLTRAHFPAGWEGTASGFRVKVYDLGPGGFGPFRNRYWLEFYPGGVGGGFWSESSRTYKGILKEIGECVKEARRYHAEAR